MEKDDIRELIFAITQSLLSLLIVAGGGYFIFANPESDSIAVIAGFIGAVLAFYFSQAIANNTTRNANQVAVETKRTGQ